MNQLIEKTPSRSINYYLKVLMIIIVFILIINIVVSILTISITRKQSIDNITNTVNLYLENAKNKLNAIDHFMIWTISHDTLLDKMENNPDMAELPTNLSNFRSRVNDFQYTTGKEFQFFIGLKEENYFFNSSSIKMNYSDYLKVKDYFFNKSEELNSYDTMSTWNPIKINNTYYLFHLLKYDNRIFLCIISVEDILLPLNNINVGEEGSIAMEKKGSGFLTNSKEESTIEKATYSFFNSRLHFEETDTSLPFTLHISVDHFGAFKNVVIVQFLLILATIIISFILFIIIRYIKNRLINPIQSFSKNLSNINSNNAAIDFEGSSIIELEQANTQFKDLITEIKKLKVNIYEQKLEKRKIQMDFMRLQIKPHFYINCLSSIHSMAELNMYDEIKEMATSTSKYFRYLFQSNQNFIQLDKEISHIYDYLDIQTLLHGNTFQFNCKIETIVRQAKIPPLVLQTFIENSIKHGISMDDDRMEISLSIEYKDKENYIYIIIKDSGPGYPLDILSKLQNKELLSSRMGEHIGINNVIQRLRMLYGEEHNIMFLNDLNGGAIVELIIPYQIYRE
ncbi:MAG TPA: histidine kinase [Niallia sp.]|nr:histidine kinase [Niallia sp.]